MNIKTILITCCITAFISGCSTRQVSDTVSGSTAQRLVTYSLETFVIDLVNQPEFSPIANTAVELKVHFLSDHPLIGYTKELLTYHLISKHNVTLTKKDDKPLHEVNVFFNSIGTDYDTYGLSIPTLGLASTANSKISILAVDMFHGITEGYATIKNIESNKIARSESLLSRVRVDKVATPIIDFPINQLD